LGEPLSGKTGILRLNINNRPIAGKTTAYDQAPRSLPLLLKKAIFQVLPAFFEW
jgi:hypothetical protein